MSSYETILYDIRGNAAWITLNRPQRRNAINDTLEHEVKDALRRADADENVRVIALTGSPPAFCAGIDLKIHRGRTSKQARAHFEAFYWGFHDTHRALSKPTLAVVNGPAVEAGCTMAYMCDMIIAAESATLSLPAVDRGIVPAYHIVNMPRIIGRYRAFEICFTGDKLSATEAAQLGLINRAVPDAMLQAKAQELIDKLAAKPAAMLKVGKELFYRTMDMDFRAGIRTAADIVALLASFEESKEGFSAFVEKRDADWTGIR